MSSDDRDDRTPDLARLTDEAKREFVPGKMDWQRMDEALFARLDAEAQAETEKNVRVLRMARLSKFSVVGGALAAAAATLFLLKGSFTEPSVTTPGTNVVAQADVTSVLSRVQGELLVSGQQASLGASLKPGDTFDLRGRRAVFDSPSTAKFMLDGAGTRGRVLREGGSIALSLEDGAVEAEVIPSSDGGSKERFSVELGRARVSVRGTHLRVARTGRKVTVDLTRGSIAVGREFVSAPAHVELDTEDANAIVIDRLNVRPAESFDEVVAAVVPAPQASAAKNDTRPAPLPGGPALPAPRAVPSAAAAPVDPKVRLEAAVRRCMLDHGFPDSSPAAHLSITTNLQMQVGDDGKVQSARFSPPLPPKAQECASVAVYGTQFGAGGPVSLSVQADK